MRKGVLSDSRAESIFAPLPRVLHDRMFSTPHLHKHGLHHKQERDDRYKPTPLTKTPHVTYHEYATMLNPQNVTPYVLAFGDQVEAAKSHVPGPLFQQRVADFSDKYPSYAAALGMLPEKAFYIQQLNASGYRIPDNKIDKMFGSKKHFHNTRFHRPAKFSLDKVSFNKMQEPLSKLHETLFNAEAKKKKTDVEKLDKLKEIYAEAQRHVIPPVAPISSRTGSSNP